MIEVDTSFVRVPAREVVPGDRLFFYGEIWTVVSIRGDSQLDFELDVLKEDLRTAQLTGVFVDFVFSRVRDQGGVPL